MRCRSLLIASCMFFITAAALAETRCMNCHTGGMQITLEDIQWQYSIHAGKERLCPAYQTLQMEKFYTEKRLERVQQFIETIPEYHISNAQVQNWIRIARQDYEALQRERITSVEDITIPLALIQDNIRKAYQGTFELRQELERRDLIGFVILVAIALTISLLLGYNGILKIQKRSDKRKIEIKKELGQYKEPAETE